MQKDKSIKLFDLCVGILIVLISLIGMFGAVNLPGIYLDAANPDYLAVQILYPQADRVSWAVPNWGFPILGQVYHGVFSAYVMAVVIKIVGSTSVVLLHTVNTIYGIIICLMTYFIMKKMNINKWISALMSICMCCMPAMFLTYRTQFYIELPGIMFMTFSIYMLLIWSDKKEFRYLFLAGFFAGFSIYCYYNLAFLFVAYLIYLIFQMKNKKNEDKLNILLIWGSGVALGIILYVVGYTEIIYIESQHRNIIMLLTLMFYLGWIALMLISTKMNKKIVYICSILAAFVFVVYAYINFVPILLSNFGEGASQEKLSLINQVLLQINSVWTYLINMITNRANEGLIFGYTVSIKPMLYVYVVIIITCISFVVWIFRSLKKKEIDNKWLLNSWICLFTYLVVAFVFAKSRLQSQHFVPLIVILAIMLALEIDYICGIAKNIKVQNLLLILCCSMLCIMSCANMYNSRAIVKELESNGGNNLCTEEINELAESAKKNYYAGEKEYYVFEDWGFMCGFNFLTSNLVSYTTNCDIEYLKFKQNEGYTIITCCWEEESKNNYVQRFEEAGFKTYFETIIKRNSEVGFYKIYAK